MITLNIAALAATPTPSVSTATTAKNLFRRRERAAYRTSNAGWHRARDRSRCAVHPRAPATCCRGTRLASAASALGHAFALETLLTRGAMELELLPQLCFSASRVQEVAKSTEELQHDRSLDRASCRTRWIAPTRRSNSARSAAKRFLPAAVNV